MITATRHRMAIIVAVLLVVSQAGAQQSPEKEPGAGEAAPAPKDQAAEKEKSAAEITTATKHKVGRERFNIEVDVEAVFEATQTDPVVLRPKIWSEFVVIRAVLHGAKVKKGDPLIWLDTEKLDERLRQAEYSRELGRLTLRLADADMELLENSLPLDLRSIERSSRLASEELEHFLKVSGPLSEKSAQFSLKRAHNSLEYAQEELQQLQKMYEADDLTEETEEIILKRARRSVEFAEFGLESTKVQTRVTLERELPQQKEQLTAAARRQQLELAKAKVTMPSLLNRKRIEREKLIHEQRQAAAQFAKLNQDRAMMPVRSPADGIVFFGRYDRGKWLDAAKVSLQLRPGGTLMAHQVLLTVVAPRPLQLCAEIPEKNLHLVRRGLRGKAVPTADPDLQLSVQVDRVSPVPVAPGTFDCLIRLDDKRLAPAIMPGMSCKIKLSAYDKANALMVPAAAVFEDDEGARYVYLWSANGKHRKRVVVVGKKSNKKIEILKGLKAGDEISLSKPKD